MNLPQKPVAWAIRLTQILQAIQKATGENFYPIRIQDIACDISKQFFPEAPLTQITADSFSQNFEGMLRKVPQKPNQWGIIYNQDIRSSGRKNYTLCHEFGHYLLHRTALPDGIQCSRENMFGWQSEDGKREAEANEFAAYMLMPRNLFEDQMKGSPLNLHLMQHVADHFDVSVTAALLRWITFTDKRAMIVVTKDGFVDWARSSESLFKSGIYLKPKQQIIELPAASLAAQKNKFFDNESGEAFDAGVWPFNEAVKEMTILADSYDMTISLLLFDDYAPHRIFEDAPPEEDAFDHFNRASFRK